MSTEYVLISVPETITAVSEGSQGPTGPQGQPGGNDSPSFTGPALFTLLSTENVRIDAKTNPRTITLGVFRIEHRAGMDGTRPIMLDIDSNGFGNTRAVVVNYLANGMDPGDESHLYEVLVDTDSSTGGEIQALSVSKSGTGSVHVTAVEALQDVNVIIQQTGLPVSITQAWKLSGTTYTDVTAAFANGTDVQIFSADNDYVICGHSSIFDQLTIYLNTVSSHTIDALFSYSSGEGTWSPFSPSDGTNGFTKSGSIMWPTLSGWVSSTVNGISKYYIRIQRTRNLVTTPPIENGITISANVEFGWDKNADISIRRARASGLPTYADRTAAIAGGLTLGQFYQTSAGVLMIV